MSLVGGHMDISRVTVWAQRFTDSLSYFLSHLPTWLSLPFALFIYSWLFLLALILGSAILAYRQLKVLKAFNEADLVRRRPGPLARRMDSIRRDIRELDAFAAAKMKNILGMTVCLLWAGIVIPGITLALIAYYQQWFLPGPPALLLQTDAGVQVASQPWQLFYFIVDQSLKGGLSDTFEVFDLAITRVTNNPENVVYSGFVLFYRVIAGAVVVTILYANARMILGLRHVKEATKKLKEQLAVVEVEAALVAAR